MKPLSAAGQISDTAPSSSSSSVSMFQLILQSTCPRLSGILKIRVAKYKDISRERISALHTKQVYNVRKETPQEKDKTKKSQKVTKEAKKKKRKKRMRNQDKSPKNCSA